MPKLNKKLITITTISILIPLTILGFVFSRHPKLIGSPSPSQASENLSINLDKNHYKPGETINFKITSLSDGQPNCDSHLELTINDQPATVYKSPTCGDPTSLTPDYNANFMSRDEGEYAVALTNTDTDETLESKFTISTQLQDYSITRWGPTRPTENSDRLPMKLTVTTQKDLKGQLIEQLPPEVSLIWQGPATLSDNTLTWDIELKAGQSQEFTYEYTISSDTAKPITLGPSKLIQNNQTVYQEPNTWQVID